MVPKKRQRRAIGHPGKPTSPILAPNDVWCADFKGQFKTGDGLLLLSADGHRWLQPLSCSAARGCSSTAVAEAKPVFTRLFKEYGLPRRIRTDNGVPFATNTLARLSQLSAWWVRLGILPELIEPGKPQQNGRHERMHRTLKAETTRPPAGSCARSSASSIASAQEFNHERPHEALDMQTPAALLRALSRGDARASCRRSSIPIASRCATSAPTAASAGTSSWVNVSIVCVGEYVGLEEIDDGIWNVYFGPLKLGRLLERHMRIEDALGRLKRHAFMTARSMIPDLCTGARAPCS